MSNTCKNCNQQFEGNFCNNCGQSVKTPQINFKFLWKDVSTSVFRSDPSLSNTLKQLFTRPGNMIRDYIAGKRVRITGPSLFLLKMALITVVIYHIFYTDLGTIRTIAVNAKNIITTESINNWIIVHYTWITLSIVPVNAAASFIVFRKQGYSFIEHIVLHAYLTGQRLAMNLIALPFFHFFSSATGTITGIVFLAGFSLTVWAYSSFFNKLSKTKVFLLTLLSLLLTLFAVAVLIVLFVIILVTIFDFHSVSAS